MRHALSICLLVGILLIPIFASAAPIPLNLDYPRFPGGPDLDKEQSLGAIIGWLYYLLVGLSGFAAFVMLVWGGVQWMSSAGNPAAVGDATKRIQSALLGLLLVLSSYIILQIINPGLVGTLSIPSL